ncbi:MAG: hypothetical protein H7X86_04720 [Gorillibacterium sp.]|nr:hypothetical protein [Gorillibacterium sp.]
MESLKDNIVATIMKRTQTGEISGAILFNDESADSSLYILITLITESDYVSQRLYNDKDRGCIQEYKVTESQLEDWLVFDGNRPMIRWVSEGDIIADRDNYFKHFQDRLRQFPNPLKDKKRLIEFSRFNRYYLRSKMNLQENRPLDAYENVLKSLHHWARLAIIEQGKYPELNLWSQIRSINLGVYKLYEELTESPESLLQRVQLVLLACEFCIVSKLEDSSHILLQLLVSRDGAWGLEEIEAQLGLSGKVTNLSLLMNQLVKKSLVREVVVPIDDTLSIMILKYERNSY